MENSKINLKTAAEALISELNVQMQILEITYLCKDKDSKNAAAEELFGKSLFDMSEEEIAALTEADNLNIDLMEAANANYAKKEIERMTSAVEVLEKYFL